VLIVLLPFAVQLAHSFEHHEHYCNTQEIHIDSHELDCSVFHFKINQDLVDFPITESSNENNLFLQNNSSTENNLISVKLHSKSSRAPPFLLFLS
jgi:hypothetical protein